MYIFCNYKKKFKFLNLKKKFEIILSYLKIDLLDLYKYYYVINHRINKCLKRQKCIHLYEYSDKKSKI